MNLPNTITLSRIPIMFLIVGLLYCRWVGSASLAFLLFIAAASGDWLDGYLARKRGLITDFGKLMDALADKIMVMGLVIALVGSPIRQSPGLVSLITCSPGHQIPVLLALVTLCREFLVTGMRLVAASKGVIVPADKGGKSKTITQLIALGFLLATPMVGRDLAYFLGRNLDAASAAVSTIGQVIFWLGTILAVWSGWRYLSQFRALVFAAAE